jgi:hypothetical protein
MKKHQYPLYQMHRKYENILNNDPNNIKFYIIDVDIFSLKSSQTLQSLTLTKPRMQTNYERRE